MLVPLSQFRASEGRTTFTVTGISGGSSAQWTWGPGVWDRDGGGWLVESFESSTWSLRPLHPGAQISGHQLPCWFPFSTEEGQRPSRELGAQTAWEHPVCFYGEQTGPPSFPLTQLGWVHFTLVGNVIEPPLNPPVKAALLRSREHASWFFPGHQESAHTLWAQLHRRKLRATRRSPFPSQF